MELFASFNQKQTALFPHTRVVTILAKVTDDHLFQLSIPEILEIVVDKNWGRAAAPMPEVAAPDHFSNTIQYVQNIRYRAHDAEDGLEFDYSHRQANYRRIEISDQQYKTNSMLIQFADGTGWFTSRQMEIITAQHLVVPQLDELRRQARKLAGPRSE